MKVCVISKADSTGGGASRVAEELAHLINSSGHCAEHRVAWANKPTGSAKLLYWRPFRRLHRYLRRIGFVETFPLELVSILKNRLIDRFDVFHFHDISTAISPFTVGFVAARKPTVWTLHDCSPFTAGCLYPMGCERYLTGCGRCPQVGCWPIDSWLDLSRLWYWCKRSVHRRNRLTYVAPSKWIANLAVQSGMIPRKPLVISNGVDSTLYVPPQDKDALRRKYGVPRNHIVLLLSAGHLGDERKGVCFAVDAILRNRDIGLCVVLMGHPDAVLREKLQDIPTVSVGYVSDARKLAECYALGDALLFCSLADNQPLTTLEALMSGIPVFGFRTGGIPEVVEDGLTGFLVAPKDVAALSRRLRDACLDANKLRTMSHNASRTAREKYSHKVFLDNHLRLYEDLLRHQEPQPPASLDRAELV